MIYTKLFLSDYAKEASKIIRNSSMPLKDKQNFINFFCELFASDRNFNETVFIDACDPSYEECPETVRYSKNTSNNNLPIQTLDLIQVCQKNL